MMGARLGARAELPARHGSRFHRPSRRALRRITIALCLALLIALVYSYGALLLTGGVSPKQTDFVPYYSSAHLVLAGHGADIYNFSRLAHYEHHLVYPLRVRDGIMPFLYPPFVALALTPLAALPIAPAFVLWLMVNVALLVVTLAMLARSFGLRGDAAALFWALGLSFLPAFVAVTQGQTSIVIFAAFAAATVALRREHPVLAGLALSVGLIKPPYVVPFLLVLLIRRRWSALGSFCVFSALLVLVPTVVLGAGADGGFLHTMVKAAQWQNQLGFAPEYNHSFEGLARLLLPSTAASAVTFALDAAALCALAWCALRAADLEAPLALAAVVALLISPHVLVHDLSFLLIPALAAAAIAGHRTRALTVLLAGGYVLTIVNLRFVTTTRVQVSVLVMSALAGFIVARVRDGRTSLTDDPRRPQGAARVAETA